MHSRALLSKRCGSCTWMCRRDPLQLPNADALIDVAGTECVAGCYRCLLSYYNQTDHELIDRRDSTAREILRAARPHHDDYGGFAGTGVRSRDQLPTNRAGKRNGAPLLPNRSSLHPRPFGPSSETMSCSSGLQTS